MADQYNARREHERQTEAEAIAAVDRIAQQLMDETEAIKHWGGERPYDGVLSMIAKRIEAAFPPEPVEHLAVPGRQRKKFTHKERMTVFRRDSYRCRYCGDDEQLTVDHVVAWSRGGSDELDNLQTLCLSCNSRKGDSDGRPPRPA